MTQQDLADLLGVSRPSVSATISRPSFPTLERIAAALNVEPWQLLAPPAVVEELKQARAQRSGVGGGGLVGVVRVGWNGKKKQRSKSKKNPDRVQTLSGKLRLIV